MLTLFVLSATVRTREVNVKQPATRAVCHPLRIIFVEIIFEEPYQLFPVFAKTIDDRVQGMRTE